MKPLSKKHSKLFRVVSTVIFSLLLFNTIALNYPQKGDPVSQILKTLEYIFFGATDVGASSSSSSSAPSDSTIICGIDPSQNPPPPPPPK